MVSQAIGLSKDWTENSRVATFLTVENFRRMILTRFGSRDKYLADRSRFPSRETLPPHVNNLISVPSKEDST
jgi:hypothetical protein